jgi:tetratricopeptide (TPR) repeat protein
MKEGSQAVLVLSAALLAGSCAWISGEHAEPAAVNAAELPIMRRIPLWIRPPAPELERSSGLRDAVALLEAGEYLPAAVLLQRLRAAPSSSAELAALQSWSLGEAGSVPEAEQVARAALAEFGAATAPVQYALAVACELGAKPEPAYQAYLYVLAAHPADPVILLACGRTALAAGQPAAAVTFFDRLALQKNLDLDQNRMRARALAEAGEFDNALDVYEAMARAQPDDPTLLAETAVAAFNIARKSKQAEHRRRTGELLERVTELDPQHADAFRMLGMNRAAAGDLAGAEESLRRALELAPAQVETGVTLSEVLVGRLRPAEARLVLQELLRQPLTREEVDEVHARLLKLGSE